MSQVKTPLRAIAVGQALQADQRIKMRKEVGSATD
jgi:hypothetical protein